MSRDPPLSVAEVMPSAEATALQGLVLAGGPGSGADSGTVALRICVE
jgi:hypothetical protein